MVIAEVGLEQRVSALENSRWRLKLNNADVLHLHEGDLVVMRIVRPIAEDERMSLVKAWESLMQQCGHPGLPLLILAGADLDLKVMRAEDVDGPGR